MQVSAEVLCALATEPQHDADLALACSLLHDTLEDTSVSFEQLAEAFGEPVAAGVLALTKNSALPKAERMADSLRKILAQPDEIALVKLADRIVNLQKPPALWSDEKIAAYKTEAKGILDALGHASPTLAVRFRAKLAAYPSL
jgi:guanosine-3',5'-bis(diphosphate) 3'-pyrophosphohydrolase